MTVAELLPPGLGRAVSPYTGIVRSLEECLHATSDPACFRFACEVGRGAGLLGRSLDHLSGIGGTGLTRAQAAAACVGEALERYSATYVPSERLAVATAAELGEAAVAPERFGLFSARQYAQPGFPFRPFARDTPVPWVAGWSLPDRREAWLPAELVFLADTRTDGGQRIGYATSSGLACAKTLDAALVRGLCEVLERDAFMIVWSTSLPLPLLDWSAPRAPLGARRRALRCDRPRVHGRRPLGLPRPPVAARRRPRSGRASGCSRRRRGDGTDARAGMVEGAERGVLGPVGGREARAPRTAAIRHGRQPRPRSFEDHIRHYADGSRAAAAAFLDASHGTGFRPLAAAARGRDPPPSTSPPFVGASKPRVRRPTG